MSGNAGPRLREAALRALRVRRWVGALNVTLVGLVYLATVIAAARIDNQSWVVISAAAVALVVAGLVIYLRVFAIGEVVEESRHTFDKGDSLGGIVFGIALFISGFLYNAVHAADLEQQPAQQVTGLVTSCTNAKYPSCAGQWSVADHWYRGTVPVENVPARTPITFSVLTSRPEVIVTAKQPLFVNGAAWMGLVVLVGFGWFWRRDATRLTRRLKDLAGTS